MPYDRAMRATVVFGVSVASCLLLACGSTANVPVDPDTALPIDSGSDASSLDSSDAMSDAEVAADAAPLDWTSVEVTKTTDKSTVEKVHYRSGALDIVGQVCRPKAEGRRAMIVFTHGGFSGLTDEWKGGACLALAEAGYAVIESSYRGEDGSQGKVEVCLGEVDDVLAMTNVALARSWSDPDRVAIFGGSHGGCIALRAIQRGLKAKVAIDLFGVTDWAGEWAFWTAARPTVTPDKQAIYDLLFTTMKDATGGTPVTHAAEYTKRSPISFVADLDAFKGDLFMIHGVEDELVQVSDSCRIASAIASVTAEHLDTSGAVVTGAPKGCETSKLTWSPPPKPASWPAKRYVVIRDGAGHGAWVPSTGISDDAVAFLVAKMPP